MPEDTHNMMIDISDHLKKCYLYPFVQACIDDSIPVIEYPQNLSRYNSAVPHGCSLRNVIFMSINDVIPVLRPDRSKTESIVDTVVFESTSLHSLSVSQSVVRRFYAWGAKPYTNAMGLDMSNCTFRSVNVFNTCNINGSSFDNTSIRGAIAFINCCFEKVSLKNLAFSRGGVIAFGSGSKNKQCEVVSTEFSLREDSKSKSKSPAGTLMLNNMVLRNCTIGSETESYHATTVLCIVNEVIFKSSNFINTDISIYYAPFDSSVTSFHDCNYYNAKYRNIRSGFDIVNARTISSLSFVRCFLDSGSHPMSISSKLDEGGEQVEKSKASVSFIECSIDAGLFLSTEDKTTRIDVTLASSKIKHLEIKYQNAFILADSESYVSNLTISSNTSDYVEIAFGVSSHVFGTVTTSEHFYRLVNLSSMPEMLDCSKSQDIILFNCTLCNDSLLKYKLPRRTTILLDCQLRDIVVPHIEVEDGSCARIAICGSNSRLSGVCYEQPKLLSNVTFKELSSTQFCELPLAEVTFSNCEYRNLKINSLCTFDRTVFRDCCFHSVDFKKCSFEGVEFLNCEFEDVRFSQCLFSGGCFKSDLNGNTRGLKNVTFSNCRFENVVLRKLHITDYKYLNEPSVFFINTKFRNCSINDDSIYRKCKLTNAVFLECMFSEDALRYFAEFPWKDVSKFDGKVKLADINNSTVVLNRSSYLRLEDCKCSDMVTITSDLSPVGTIEVCFTDQYRKMWGNHYPKVFINQVNAKSISVFTQISDPERFECTLKVEDVQCGMIKLDNDTNQIYTLNLVKCDLGELTIRNIVSGAMWKAKLEIDEVVVGRVNIKHLDYRIAGVVCIHNCIVKDPYESILSSLHFIDAVFEDTNLLVVPVPDESSIVGSMLSRSSVTFSPLLDVTKCEFVECIILPATNIAIDARVEEKDARVEAKGVSIDRLSSIQSQTIDWNLENATIQCSVSEVMFQRANLKGTIFGVITEETEVSPNFTSVSFDECDFSDTTRFLGVHFVSSDKRRVFHNMKAESHTTPRFLSSGSKGTDESRSCIFTGGFPLENVRFFEPLCIGFERCIIEEVEFCGTEHKDEIENRIEFLETCIKSVTIENVSALTSKILKIYRCEVDKLYLKHLLLVDGVQFKSNIINSIIYESVDAGKDEQNAHQIETSIINSVYYNHCSGYYSLFDVYIGKETNIQPHECRDYFILRGTQVFSDNSFTCKALNSKYSNIKYNLVLTNSETSISKYKESRAVGPSLDVTDSLLSDELFRLSEKHYCSEILHNAIDLFNEDELKNTTHEFRCEELSDWKEYMWPGSYSSLKKRIADIDKCTDTGALMREVRKFERLFRIDFYPEQSEEESQGYTFTSYLRDTFKGQLPYSMKDATQDVKRSRLFCDFELLQDTLRRLAKNIDSCFPYCSSEQKAFSICIDQEKDKNYLSLKLIDELGGFAKSGQHTEENFREWLASEEKQLPQFLRHLGKYLIQLTVSTLVKSLAGSEEEKPVCYKYSISSSTFEQNECDCNDLRGTIYHFRMKTYI